MTFWTSCSTSIAALLLVVGCGCALERSPREPSTGMRRVVLLPMENLSTAAAPIAELRDVFRDHLQGCGIDLLPEKELEAFMERHRLRWSGGVERSVAEAVRSEAGADALLVTTLTLYNEESSPRIGMTARLVAAGGDPAILWSDSVALTGDGAPGLLDRGRIDDMQRLREVAFARLAESLAGQLAGRPASTEPRERRYRPKVHYRSADLADGRNLSVAILPFINQSEKRSAGDLMALHFLHHLQRTGTFKVLEPGALREELLGLRVIIPDGASLDTADLLFERLDVDLLLSGKVTVYHQAATAAPRVSFSVEAIDRTSRRVVWSSQSENRGDESVYFFDLGRVSTAHALASRMAGEVVRLLAIPPANDRLPRLPGA